MIPQILHFIILEDAHNHEILDNIRAWKNVNVNFETYLWVDSRSLTQPFLKSLIEGAKSLNLELIDVKTIKEVNSEVYEKEIGIRERSKNTAKELNIQAAFNLLKVNVLLHHGGFYLDNEINPSSLVVHGNEPILINYDDSDYGLNMNALAVMPDDPIIRHLKYLQEKNLKELYYNPRLLHFYMVDKIGPECTRIAYTQNHTGAQSFIQAIMQYNKSLVLSMEFKRRYKLKLSQSNKELV